MQFDFDHVVDRKKSNSLKWKTYPEDVLPLWVADMDFPAPQPIRTALCAAIEHGVFGYESPSKELKEIVAERMQDLYAWRISPEAIVAVPGIVSGFTAAAHAVCSPGEGVIVQPPVYPPFLRMPSCLELVRQDAWLVPSEKGGHLFYRIDWDVLGAPLNSRGARTGMFLLCNPHNPTGQIFKADELKKIAELCLQNRTIICSDEIHAEILLDNSKFTPLAALDAEVASQTITLIAPSKTFNIAGLFCGFAIIPDRCLRERYTKSVDWMAMHVNSLGLIAAQAAFSGDCEEWLTALRVYLTRNRDYLFAEIENHFPGIAITSPEATYLAWLDCRKIVMSRDFQGSVHKFFLEKARVALNDGESFGSGCETFLRLNFGCPRRTLEEALVRMKKALE